MAETWPCTNTSSAIYGPTAVALPANSMGCPQNVYQIASLSRCTIGRGLARIFCTLCREDGRALRLTKRRSYSVSGLLIFTPNKYALDGTREEDSISLLNFLKKNGVRLAFRIKLFAGARKRPRETRFVHMLRIYAPPSVSPYQVSKP